MEKDRNLESWGIPEGYKFTMRGKKASQPHVREIGLATHHLILTPLSEDNPHEMERMKVHLELMPADGEETSCYQGPVEPVEGTPTHFWHAGWVVFDEYLVWSYCTLDAPNRALGSFKSVNEAVFQLTHAVQTGHLSPVYSDEAEKKNDRIHGTVFEQCHASFGSARLYRGGCHRDGTLYGSKVKHGHSMTLSISRDSSRRNITRDWRSPTTELIEIEMSATQFGDLITNQHEGIGVPVTIRYVMGKGMPDVPKLPGVKEIVQEDVKTLAEDLTKNLDALEKEILGNEGKIGKRRAEDLLHKLGKAKYSIEGGLAHLHGQFIKSCEKTIADARATIDASFGILTRDVGAQVLAGKTKIELTELRAPEIIEFENPEKKALPEGESDDVDTFVRRGEVEGEWPSPEIQNPYPGEDEDPQEE